jgi:hypothetical protein
MKKGCPYCFMLRLALLEAGRLDRVEIAEFDSGSPQEALIRGKLAEHPDVISFPAAEIAPGHYLRETGDLIAHFLGEAGVDAKVMPTLQAYREGVFRTLTGRR